MSQSDGPQRRRLGVPTWLKILIALGVGVALTISILFDQYRLPSTSMAPGYPLGTTVWVWVFADAPERGDVVVFDVDQQGERVKFIKRVVGLAGDVVELRDHELFVNGAPLSDGAAETGLSCDLSDGVTCPCSRRRERSGDRTWTVQTLDGSHLYCRRAEDAGPFTVPHGAVFVLGDNRDQSQDSRYFGAVPESDLRGLVVGSL